jgi:hypothetical protein
LFAPGLVCGSVPVLPRAWLFKDLDIRSKGNSTHVGVLELANKRA